MDLPKKKTKPNRSLTRFKFLIYGVPKVGKTTFAAQFPDALFIATEDGHLFQDIFVLSPKDWTDVRAICMNLIKEKDQKQFKTVVFDVADNAYEMCESYICKKENVQHVSDLPFGKGYRLVRSQFMSVVHALGQVGYGLVFLSHSKVKEVEDKNTKRSFVDTTMSGQASKVISGLCDFIFYCYIDDDENRWMITKGSKAINAGDRSGLLPKKMKLDYKELEKQLTVKQ